MSKLNLFAPQWQGSGITKELYYGGKAMKSYIEDEFKSVFNDISINSDCEPKLDNNIYGYNLILQQLIHIESMLERQQPSKTFALGGGCGIEVPIVSYLVSRYQDITIFWFDAHGDLNSPEESASKHFHGMPLRLLLDEKIGIGHLKISKATPRKTWLLGTRDLDEPEQNYIDKYDVNLCSVEQITNSTEFERLLCGNTGPSYIHIDLDVLEPSIYKNVKCPTKGGITIETLEKSLQIIGKLTDVVGISIVENLENDSNKLKMLNEVIRFACDF